MEWNDQETFVSSTGAESLVIPNADTQLLDGPSLSPLNLQDIQGGASTSQEQDFQATQTYTNPRKRSASESSCDASSSDGYSNDESDSSSSNQHKRTRWKKDTAMPKHLHTIACGTCSKTYSKKSELSRHQTQLLRGCSIVPRDTGCTLCGATSHTAEELAGVKVEREFLGKDWRRRMPRVHDHPEDCETLNDGRPAYKYFCGRTRETPDAPWRDYHIEFIDHPKQPQPKYSEDKKKKKKSAK